MLIKFFCEHCRSPLEIEAGNAGANVACPHCNRSMQAPPAVVGPDTTIGGFRVKRLLGKGGMGEVYLARQLSMDREVAVKILPSHLTQDKEEVERFLKEVRTAARLEHAHIVPAYDAGEDHGTYYLAMAYVDGVTLEDRLQKGPLPEREALRIVRYVAQALAYAWEDHRIIHRDVKPSNIMIDQRGTIKLTDLGLSKTLEEGTGKTVKTLAETVVGTPNYMSPEQAQGRQAIDFRTDQYSLGATLYHMLTGQTPFAGPNVADTFRRLATETLPDPREKAPAVSEACTVLVETLMAREPGFRYPKWEAFLKDLARVEKGTMPTRRLPRPRLSVLERNPAAAHARRRKQLRVKPAGGGGGGAAAAAAGASPGSASAPSPPAPAGPSGALIARLAAAGFAVLLLILFLVAALRSANRRPTPPPATPGRTGRGQVVDDPGRRQREEADRLTHLDGQITALLELPRRDSKDFSSIVGRLKQFQRDSDGTAVAERAAREIENLTGEWKQAAREAFDTLQAEARRRFDDGRRREALRMLTQYMGPFARETQNARRTLAADFERKIGDHQDAETARRARIEDAVNEVTAAVEGIADPINRMDFDTAREVLETALKTVLGARSAVGDPGLLAGEEAACRRALADVQLLETAAEQGVEHYGRSLVGTFITLGPVRGRVERVADGTVYLAGRHATFEQPLPELPFGKLAGLAVRHETDAARALRIRFLTYCYFGPAGPATALLPKLAEAGFDAAYDTALAARAEAAENRRLKASAEELAAGLLARLEDCAHHRSPADFEAVLRELRQTCSETEAFRAAADRIESLRFVLMSRASAVDTWNLVHGDAVHTGRSRFTGPAEPQLKWLVPDIVTPAAIGTDGTIYGCRPRELCAVAPDGRVKWTVSLDDAAAPQACPAVGRDNTVYVFTRGGTVVAARFPGRKKWALPLDGDARGSPVIGKNGLVHVVCALQTGRLYAVGPEGRLRWAFDMLAGFHGHETCSPAVAPDGTVYTGSKEGELYAVANGVKQWNLRLGGTVGTPILGADNRLYVTTTAGRGALVAASTAGERAWSAEVGHGAAYSAPVLCSSGTLYVARGRLACAAGDGTVRWLTDGNPALLNVLALDAAGTIYVRCREGNLRALAPDGKEKWLFAIGNHPGLPSLAIGKDGTLYVTADSKLHAIGGKP